MKPDLYLASQSPRRQELLRQLGVRFSVLPARISEAHLANEAPADYVQRLALQKASYIWDKLDPEQRRPVLGADTIVVIDDRILGKPRGRDDAAEMLRLLSGRSHQVLTGVALVSQQHSVCVNVSIVRFRELLFEEIQHYWETNEPGDKAGGYAIQGYGAAFVEDLKGSYSGVMGLPLCETAQLLKSHQIPIWQMEDYE